MSPTETKLLRIQSKLVFFYLFPLLYQKSVSTMENDEENHAFHSEDNGFNSENDGFAAPEVYNFTV